jgi:hypothetical protein
MGKGGVSSFLSKLVLKDILICQNKSVFDIEIGK